MIAGKTRVRRPTMERARQRFERWRRTRAHFAPIPAALWALAVEVAREYGVNPTAHFLHLNHTSLKKHVQEGEKSARPGRSPARFVELVPPGLSPCTIELENAQGGKMRIHLASPQALDWVALSRSFWSTV
jgi:hypothetical protein